MSRGSHIQKVCPKYKEEAMEATCKVIKDSMPIRIKLDIFSNNLEKAIFRATAGYVSIQGVNGSVEITLRSGICTARYYVGKLGTTYNITLEVTDKLDSLINKLIKNSFKSSEDTVDFAEFTLSPKILKVIGKWGTCLNYSFAR